MMKKSIIVVVFLFLLINVLPVLAQDPNMNITGQPAIGTVTQGTRGIGRDNPSGAGSHTTYTNFLASKFTVPLYAGSPTLTYDAFHYYNSPGSATPLRYYAQIDLEPGVVIDHFTCFFNDNSATNNLTFVLQKYTTDFNTSSRSGVYLGSGSSSGTPGLSWLRVDLPTPETFDPMPAGPTGYISNFYYLAADVANDTSFAGCLVSWTRHISPAPSTASFIDVPTSHPFFQHIEALYASGITTGCSMTPLLYCPDQYVTRGQMAAFLARALGLNWPY
jgi:hypothetical protein